jgi:hypothetical protein
MVAYHLRSYKMDKAFCALDRINVWLSKGVEGLRGEVFVVG